MATCLRRICLVYRRIVVYLQHYLTMVCGMIISPLLVSSMLCVGNDMVLTSQIFATMIFVCGIGTLLQTVVGSRPVHLPSLMSISGRLTKAIRSYRRQALSLVYWFSCNLHYCFFVLVALLLIFHQSLFVSTACILA